MLAVTTSRSEFIGLAGSFCAGLMLEFSMPARAAAPGGVFAPNVWLKIAADETVTIMVAKTEMGQGVIMGMPTIVADELDAAPAHMRTEFAPPDPRYIDKELQDQVTGGSTAVHSSWLPLRRAGATARAMLVAAAAAEWDVPPSSCTTRESVVYHVASGRRATYGNLAAAASRLPVPADVALKRAADFRLIGRARQRTDIPPKVNGSAIFGIDVRIPGMKYAAIARSPVFGGRVKSYDARRALAVPGVDRVVRISNGIAVVGNNTWAAFKGKSAVSVVWDEGANAKLSSEKLFAEAEFYARHHTHEHVAVTRGKPETATGDVIEAVYRGPFLAHATMEPMNTTVDVRKDRCEVWSPTQVQRRAQAAAAAVTGLDPERCVIHTTFAGGGFGRRLEVDFVQEAVEISKAIGAPVKVTWTREDDIQGDFYRPMSVNVIRGVVKGDAVTALSHQVVSPSWFRRWAPSLIKNGVDDLDLLGVLDAPYDVPNVRISYIDHEHGIPVGSWRAPDANWNAFVTESFMDELAHLAGADPLTFRLAQMQKHPRAAHVLQLAAERAGWGTPLPRGVGRGLATTFWAGSYAGMVAEVSIENGSPRVHRVVAAVDCGVNVNPDISSSRRKARRISAFRPP
ncbi:MAG TPA: molybdopterin cofactor-binding domain-containing protein [Candidatus Elarobacter sp.]|nr:molybdopterin cofactor-binding domain-containing protein [Candidatus Elarobacter sp.]